jgi:hypothetical protein
MFIGNVVEENFDVWDVQVHGNMIFVTIT